MDPLSIGTIPLAGISDESPDGAQSGMSIPDVVSEHPGGVVIQQRVDQTVGCCQTQRHHYSPLQRQHDAAAPTVSHSV